jgi:hypothetical protein
MHRAFFAALLGTLLCVTGACKSKTGENAAIRDGVVKHIASMNGLNVNNMTIVVTQATVNGDKAQASVDIRAKNGEPGAPAMQLTYDLQKQGGEWVVLKGQATGGMQHPAPGEMPQPGSLPPGHPSTGGTSGQMPANHPDFNSILSTAQPPSQQAPAQQTPAPQPNPPSGKP